ncbi:MAG: carboxypeptidase-like regulatory domain-containing protein [Pseudobdellovibrionaceae bacterium]
MKKLFIALAAPALIVGCSKKQTGQIGGEGTPGIFSTQENNVITVKSADDQPLAGAQILIGDALNDPFSGNFLTTDPSGQVQIPAAWNASQTVTVQAPGYIRMTYIAQEPGPITFKLRPLPEKISYEVRGTVTGLPIEDKDGYVDFGLIMPAFTKLDMLAFNINNVISPQNDHISVMSQNVSIPANISLPEQQEKYSFFTITLDKPTYRIYYGRPGVNRVFAARGRFPFKSTVDGLRGGSQFYEMINSFKLSGGSIRDIDVKTGSNPLDLPARELNFTDSRSIVPPQLAADETFLALGVANQSGYMIPTDVKKVSSNQKPAITINMLPNSDQLFLGVLKKTADLKSSSDRMSVTLVPCTPGLNPAMLPLVQDPTLTNDGLVMPKVNSIDGVHPIATYSVLSVDEEVQQGPAKVNLHNPKWEIFTQSWVDHIKLPQWPNDAPFTGKKRWEVNFIGSQTASQSLMGPAMIDSATHVTHSSISF